MPGWITVRCNENKIKPVADYLEHNSINTVCESAVCPNRWTCYADKELTFMILGERCTRQCGFCGVSKGIPEKVDTHEYESILDTIRWLGADYTVITSVTRDDLPDRGAYQFAKVIGTLKGIGTHVEVLIPDFDGDESLIKTVINAGPDIIGHNMETVYGLYPSIRPLSDYGTSLSVLETIKKLQKGMITKSGIMLGFGERMREVKELMQDIRSTDCEMLTIGQYLKPAPENTDVKAYLHPEVFKMLEEYGYKLGFKAVYSSPFTRSSFHARDMWMKALRN